MKVVLTDNYARETVADRLLLQGVNEEEARRAADEYNKGRRGDYWAIVVPDDYRLSRGMEDLV